MCIRVYLDNNIPCEEQILAAAKEWLEWQFPKMKWEIAAPPLQKAFCEASRKALTAVARIGCRRKIAAV